MVQGHWFRNSLLGIALACAPPLVARGLAAGVPAPPTPMAATVPATVEAAASATTDPFPRNLDAPLTGRVIDFASRQPISGATVQLVPVPTSELNSDPPIDLTRLPVPVERVPARAVTRSDQTGRYRLVSASGVYRVRATAEGYPTLLGPKVRMNADRPAPFLEVPLRAKGALVVEVLTGEAKAIPGVRLNLSGEASGWATSIECSTDDAGQCVVEVPSEVSLSLSMKAWNDPMRRRPVRKVAAGARDKAEVKLDPLLRLTGRVVDKGGRPLPGARIEYSGSSSKDETTTEAVSGERGVFELLAPERVTSFRAELLGYCTDKTLHENEAPLEVVLDRCASVGGRVVDASSGKPLPGAIVRSDMERARTDVSGHYVLTFRDLTRQPRLSARLDGYKPGGATPTSLRQGEHRLGIDIPLQLRPVTSRVRGIVLDQDTGAPVVGAQLHTGFSPSWRTGEDGRFEVDAPDDSFSFRIEAEGRTNWSQRLELRGTTLDLSVSMLRQSTITGRILDAEGHPVTYARVRLYASDGMSPNVTDFTGKDGLYCLQDVPSGVSFRLMAYHHEHGATEVGELNVMAGERRSGVDLVFGPSTALTGLVVDERGRPVERARVWATARRDQFERPGPRTLFEYPGPRELPGDQDQTSSDGRFELDPLPAGVYTLQAESVGERFSIPRRVRLPLQPGHPPIQLELVPTELIHGRALDAKGSPVKGVHFSVVPGQHSPRPKPPEDVVAWSDSDGNFRLGPMPRGYYKLKATHAARNWTQTLDVRAPADDIEVLVPATASIHGRVLRAADGEAVQTFRVAANFVSEADRSPGRTSAQFGDVDGWFVLEELPTGPITLEVSSPGFAPQRVSDLRLEPGHAVTGVEVRLHEAGSVAGVVLDAMGKPVAGAEVKATMSNEEGSLAANYRFSSTTLTGASGEFKFADLPGGRLTLIASDPARGECRFSVKVLPGEERGGIELRLAPPGRAQAP